MGNIYLATTNEILHYRNVDDCCLCQQEKLGKFLRLQSTYW